MRYLKYRNDFLKENISIDKIDVVDGIKNSVMINEALENDLRWGDSLIGRLINSTIRKFNIYRKRTSISGLVTDFKRELDALLEELIFSEEKSEIQLANVKYLLASIHEVVISEKSTGEKIGILLGVKPEYNAKLKQTIEEINKIDERILPNKEELINKLENFMESLKKIDVEPEETEEEEEKKEKPVEKDMYEDIVGLLKSVRDLGIEVDKSKKSTEVKKSEPTIEKMMGFKNFLDILNEKESMGLIKYNPDSKSVDNIPKNDKSVTTTSKEVVKGKTEPQPEWEYGKEVGKSKPKPKPGEYIDYDDKNSEEEKGLVKNSEEEKGLVTTKKPVQTKTPEDIIWMKIVKAYDQSGLSKMMPRIKELIEKSERGEEVEKKWVITIGKQLIVNQQTVGKNKLTYEQLIKEGTQQVPTSYNDIPKAITLLGNVVLALTGHPETVKNLKRGSQQVSSLISTYNNILNSGKVNEGWKLVNEYAESEDMDRVQKSWYEYFKKGEEKEWKLSDEMIKKLVDKSNKSENEKKNVEMSSEKGKKVLDDHIIKIVNIFGRAWDKYAVDEIPSGRTNAVISQKTFREYMYMGKSGSRPKFDKDSGPGYGPWASKRSFQIWQDGVMKILEDGKYRKVLANINFISKPEEETKTVMKEPGSGITLFNFINDMLGYGEDFDFRSKRERILKKYFNTDKKFGNEGGGNPTPIISRDNKGDSSHLIWGTHNNLYGKGLTITNVKDYGLRKFFKMEFVDDKDGKTKEIICYPVDVFDGDRKNYLIVRFHMGEPKCKKESMITEYMKNLSDEKIRNKKIPVDMENKLSKIYIGVLPIGFQVKSKLSFKYVEIGNLRQNMEPKDLLVMEVNGIKNISYLKYLEDKKDGSQISHIVTFGEDDLIDRRLKTKPINDRDYTSIKDTLIKEIKRGIFDN